MTPNVCCPECGFEITKALAQSRAEALEEAARVAEDARKVTRFEVIDEGGRAYTRWGVKIDLSYQDDGRTLKVFVKPDASQSASTPETHPKKSR